jgi:hypothetical protein
MILLAYLALFVTFLQPRHRWDNFDAHLFWNQLRHHLTCETFAISLVCVESRLLLCRPAKNRHQFSVGGAVFGGYRRERTEGPL